MRRISSSYSSSQGPLVSNSSIRAWGKSRTGGYKDWTLNAYMYPKFFVIFVFNCCLIDNLSVHDLYSFPISSTSHLALSLIKPTISHKEGTRLEVFSKTIKAKYNALFLAEYFFYNCLTMKLSSVVLLLRLKPNCIVPNLILLLIN